MDNELDNGWKEWGKYVLNELKELKQEQKETRKDVSEIKTNVAITKNDIKIRAGIWGAIASMIPVTIALIFVFLK